jgi:hypothetical protein
MRNMLTYFKISSRKIVRNYGDVVNYGATPLNYFSNYGATPLNYFSKLVARDLIPGFAGPSQQEKGDTVLLGSSLRFFVGDTSAKFRSCCRRPFEAHFVGTSG